jgi:hypothetical protein
LVPCYIRLIAPVAPFANLLIITFANRSSSAYRHIATSFLIA